MKYLICAICALIVSLAFSDRKCEHVFTQVEQAAIKIEQPNLYGGITLSNYYWPSGLQEGKDLICVKCFHVQKQMLDYGQPVAIFYGLPNNPPLNSCDTLPHSFLKIDSSWLK